MANLKYKTRGDSSPQGKPRVYFCCHPDDFNKYFDSISDEILAKQNCAIWYIDEAAVRDEDFLMDCSKCSFSSCLSHFACWALKTML